MRIFDAYSHLALQGTMYVTGDSVSMELIEDEEDLPKILHVPLNNIAGMQEDVSKECMCLLQILKFAPRLVP